jgi:N-acetyl-gamma-glutamyl-phosphate reductase
MKKVSIIGATGYTGGELVKILLDHPKVELASLFAKIDKPSIPIDEEFPRLKGKTNMVCRNFEMKDIPLDVDLVFLAVPHTVAIDLAPLFLDKKIKVIDLSADFRLQDPAVYQKWYGKTHTRPDLLKEAVYGLPELFRDNVKGAQLIANPGCFPTSILLGMAPVVKETEGTIYIDSKTGTSGAGKKAAIGIIFSECTNNIRPYKVLNHQHRPEIEQELGILAGKNVNTCFVPELSPIDRGILTTMFMRLKKPVPTADILAKYNELYKNSPFVHVLPEGTFPELKNVIYSNTCHIGVKSVGEDLLVITAIDNLVKGAAGQAVQNMNIMFGFPEETALI